MFLRCQRYLYHQRQKERKELSDEHKKLWAADEATLKTAEKMINAEFGLVLGINADDVPAFIERTLNT